MTLKVLDHRDERDFGLETETETRVVSVSVSSFETRHIKSQSQSQNLRLISKVSVSVSNYETSFQKSRSQSQYAKTGLAHHRIFYICEVRLGKGSKIKLIIFAVPHIRENNQFFPTKEIAKSKSVQNSLKHVIK